MKTLKIETQYSGSACDGGWTSDADISVRVETVTALESRDEWRADGYFVDADIRTGKPQIIEVNAEDEPTYQLAAVAEACGLCGDTTECQLLIYALRRYADIRTALGIDPAIDTDWTPMGMDDLDSAEPDDYEALADMVSSVFGAAAGEAQRTATQQPV